METNVYSGTSRTITRNPIATLRAAWITFICSMGTSYITWKDGVGSRYGIWKTYIMQLGKVSLNNPNRCNQKNSAGFVCTWT